MKKITNFTYQHTRTFERFWSRNWTRCRQWRPNQIHLRISRIFITTWRRRTCASFTRLIDDPALSREYAVPVEIINDKLDIRRIPFLGKRYKAKEQLWEGLDTFVNGAMQHIKQHNIFPDWIHSHYADAGYAAAELSAVLNIPFAHTGHSLGFYKKKNYWKVAKTKKISKKFKFKARIAAEEKHSNSLNLSSRLPNKKLKLTRLIKISN